MIRRNEKNPLDNKFFFIIIYSLRVFSHQLLLLLLLIIISATFSSKIAIMCVPDYADASQTESGVERRKRETGKMVE